MNHPLATASLFVTLMPLGLLAMGLTAGLILLLMPWLRAYALARPNARSSHREPTPQGGGAAVVTAALAVLWGGIALVPIDLGSGDIPQLSALTIGAVVLAMIGGIDDIHPLPPLPRLLLQGAAVAFIISALPAELRLAPILPVWAERAILLLAAVWVVNLTNFMDGIDLMTVVEVVPIALAIVLLWLMGTVSFLPALVAMALAGAVLGFAPFNWPVARLFLGDVGSLPIGLLLAWLLLQVARTEAAAALILPLYYLADATITLARRAAAGEPVWQAHRTHFYQRALAGGFTVGEIVWRVFALNAVLAALALAAAATANRGFSIALVGAAAILVILQLMGFARGKS